MAGSCPTATTVASVPTVVLTDGTSFTGGAGATMQYPGPPVALGGDRQALVGPDPGAPAAGQGGRSSTRAVVTSACPASPTMPSDPDHRRARRQGPATYLGHALGYDDPGSSGLTPAQREARAQVDVRHGGGRRRRRRRPRAPTPRPPTRCWPFPPSRPRRPPRSPSPTSSTGPSRASPLAQQPDCTDLTGGDATTFAAALEKATSITVWRSGGKHWHLATRATLPGDDPCGETG